MPAQATVATLRRMPACFAALVFASALPARVFAQSPTPPATATPGPPVGSIDLSKTDSNLGAILLGVLVLVYALLLVVAVLWPILRDINQAYSFARETRTEIIDKLSGSQLDAERLTLLLQDLDRSPPGIPGLGRASLAWMIILILGITMIQLLVFPTNLGNNNGVIGTVVTILSTAVVSITAFYFGGKATMEATQQGAQAAQTAAAAPGTTAPLSITTPSPLPTGTVGQPYTATLQASGGQPPYQWVIAKQPAAGGISIDATSGVLQFQATPLTQDPDGFEVLIQVTDGAHTTVTRTFRIIVPATQPTAATPGTP